jgi:hypothetical protein
MFEIGACPHGKNADTPKGQSEKEKRKQTMNEALPVPPKHYEY